MADFIKHYAWHPADFRRDTRHLSIELRGVYRELLDEMWMRQPNIALPDDDKAIANILGWTVKKWREAKKVLLDAPLAVLKRSQSGELIQPRLRREYEIAEEKSRKASVSGALRKNIQRSEAAIAQRTLSSRSSERSANAGANAQRTLSSSTSERSTNQNQKNQDSHESFTRVREVAEAWNERCEEFGKQPVTRAMAQSLARQIAEVDREIRTLAPEFSWRECIGKIHPKSFLAARMDTFGFSWLLRRDRDGVQWNALRVWHGEHGAPMRSEPQFRREGEEPIFGPDGLALRVAL